MVVASAILASAMAPPGRAQSDPISDPVPRERWTFAGPRRAMADQAWNVATRQPGGQRRSASASTTSAAASASKTAMVSQS
jgi:hypothetical protein